MYSFVYSKEDLIFENNITMFHDYPPKKIQDDDLNKSFADFFEGSDRQLININEEDQQ